ncbi:uncharacterized protein LOC143333046 [Chaetodon auriga]|uniref:uncharacterized protein LOC143333046 n=1 Tax=Chaetodon auriga TaxID=39042 RepID=UPI004032BF61
MPPSPEATPGHMLTTRLTSLTAADPEITAAPAPNQPYDHRRQPATRGYSGNSYRPQRPQQPSFRTSGHRDAPPRNAVQSQDPDFTAKVRILHKIIKSAHHFKNVSGTEPPPIIRKTTQNLANFIKPASPRPQTQAGDAAGCRGFSLLQLLHGNLLIYILRLSDQLSDPFRSPSDGDPPPRPPISGYAQHQHPDAHNCRDGNNNRLTCSFSSSSSDQNYGNLPRGRCCFPNPSDSPKQAAPEMMKTPGGQNLPPPAPPAPSSSPSNPSEFLEDQELQQLLEEELRACTPKPGTSSGFLMPRLTPMAPPPTTHTIILFFTYLFDSSSSDGETSRPSKRKRGDEEASSSARDLIKQILQMKPGGTTVLEEYEETGTLCDTRRRQMVNILAAHMVETEGRIPQRVTKEKYALGIVTLFPALKDPLSRKGYEHFYDSQSGSGFLAWRLKTIQRKTKLGSKESKIQTGGGGPRQERELPQIGGQLDEERCKEVISLMNHTSDREIILQKMKETFEYRQHLIHNPDESHNILSVFPRLLDIKGLIHQDFSLLFGQETAAKLLEKWYTSFKGKVIREAESLTTTPVLQSLLKSAKNPNNDWDSDMASLLLLLHILPPQPNKKKTQKISAAQAMDHLVVFHKSCRSLQEHLENQEGHRQPYLLASGTSRQAISAYYIVTDKKLIPCQGATSLAAFDELFKVHFVFSVSYDDALSNMYTFLQTTVYSIDVDTTKESPKLKELRAKFMNRS